MKIGIDIRSLQSRQKYQGVGYYTKNLVDALIGLNNPVEWTLYSDSQEIVDPINNKDKENYRIVQMPGTGKLLDELLCWAGFPIRLIKDGTQLIHFPSINSLSGILLCPYVVTIHDMLPLVYPDIFLKRGYRHKILYSIASKANHIIAVSEYTKKDVVRFLNIPPEKITVVHSAPHPRFYLHHGKDDIFELIIKKYKLPLPFILYVGDLSTASDNYRKNVDLLFQAEKILIEDYGIRYNLVLAGKTGEYSQQLISIAHSMGIGDYIKFTGYVADEDLPCLYHLASLLAYPSRYEGFGLPIVESMACGTPVVSTDVTSIPEVADGAALLVKPDDPGDFAKAVYQVITDKNLSHSLSEKGLMRASELSWQKTACATFQVYQEVILKI